MGRDHMGKTIVDKFEMNYCKAATQGMDGEGFVWQKQSGERKYGETTLDICDMIY